MTKMEKLWEMREKLGSGYNDARNNICRSIAVTHVSEMFNNVFVENYGIDYKQDRKLSGVYGITVDLVYNSLRTVSFYFKDTMWTEKNARFNGMQYLIENIINEKLGDFTEKDFVNGYMLGYRALQHAYDDLFTNEIDD